MKRSSALARYIMKKNPVTESAPARHRLSTRRSFTRRLVGEGGFLNRHVLIGMACCLTGASLALAGFGQNRWEKSHLDGPGAGLATESPETMPTPGAAITFTVTNTAVSGLGSLRQAILDANGNSGADTINFNIPASDPNCNVTTHVCTITPTAESPVPFITGTVTIDGYSQPGASVPAD